MSEEKLARIALNAVPYMHPNIYPSSRLGVWLRVHLCLALVHKRQLAEIKDVTPGLADAIKAIDPEKVTNQEISNGPSRSVRQSMYVRRDPGYPKPISKVFAPPPVLSIQGQWLDEDEASVAIVGTRGSNHLRKADDREADQRACRSSGITVISGLARGVDGVAHRVGEYREGGRTMASARMRAEH